MSCRLVSLTSLVIAAIASQMLVVSANAAPVQTAVTQALQVSSKFPSASVSKMLKTSTPGYLHIAPTRHQAITLGNCVGLKNRLIKKHIKGLVPQSGFIASEEPNQISELTEPEIESMDLSGKLEPVAYSSPLAAQVIKNQLPGCLSWQYSTTCHFVDGKLTIEKNKGEVILWASEDTDVELHLADVHIKRDSIVLLRSIESGVRLVNLYDTRRDAVSVKVGDKTFYLRPGEECIVADSEKSLKSCKRCNGSLRRFTKTCSCGDCSTVAGICEVSIPALLKHHPILKNLYKSDTRHERKLAEKLLKMSVCLAHFTRSYTPYSTEN